MADSESAIFFDKVGSATRPNKKVFRPIDEEIASSGTAVDSGPSPRWAHSDDVFWPASETCDRLNAGFYRFDQVPNVGICLRRSHISVDNLIRLPDSATQSVLEEFSTFWGLEDRFKARGLLHKRGILLWGAPGCLASETKIHYQAFVDGECTFQKCVTIERLYQIFSLSPKTEIRVPSVDDQGRIFNNRVRNVIKSGKKNVYRLLTTSGLQIFATKDHRFLSDGTYLPLEALTSGQMVNVHKLTYDHATPEEIESIQFIGERETYDIEMEGPHHNFVADNFIVHNSGKTASLMLMAQDIVENHDGIVCQIEHPGLASAGLTFIRKIEPERPIVALIEDLDALVDRHGENQFLSLLDGETQVNRIVYVATTNYPERLDKRFVDRPSRFDTIRWIGMPGEAARRMYLQTKEPSLVGSELEYWVQNTEGFSVAHLRELVILVKCFDRSLKEAIQRLEAMRLRHPKSNDTPDKPIFGIVGSRSDEKSSVASKRREIHIAPQTTYVDIPDWVANS